MHYLPTPERRAWLLRGVGAGIVGWWRRIQVVVGVEVT